MTVIESPRPGLVKQALMLFCAACAAGCSAGSGEGLNISGRPIEEGGDVPLAATLVSIQANVFDPTCIVCHAGANAPLGLRLDQANSFTNLVGVRSVQEPSVFRVDPGNPDQSYLVHKLEGTASTGTKMPLGGPPIPRSTIEFVRQWISDGAQETSNAAPARAPKVLSMRPDPNSVIALLPMQITVAFDQRIDASTVNRQTFELRRSGSDGVFGNGDDVFISPAYVEISPLNAQLAILDLAGVTPVDDQYRLTVRGSGASMVLGNSSAALDGEYASEFPSGDNAEGGDFVAEFWLRINHP